MLNPSFPFFLVLCLLFSCNPLQPSDKFSANMQNTISSDAITGIVFSRDKGSVPPQYQRQYVYEISTEKIVLTTKDNKDKLLSTKEVALTDTQFKAICNQLADHKINVPCTQQNNKEPMPPGGYSAVILLKSNDKQLEQTYYVGGNKVYGCGDVIAFDNYLKELVS